MYVHVTFLQNISLREAFSPMLSCKSFANIKAPQIWGQIVGHMFVMHAFKYSTYLFKIVTIAKLVVLEMLALLYTHTQYISLIYVSPEFYTLFVVFYCRWVHTNSTLQLEQSHQCCKERSYEMREITLTCSKNSLSHFTYRHVTGCECRVEG